MQRNVFSKVLIVLCLAVMLAAAQTPAPPAQAPAAKAAPAPAAKAAPPQAGQAKEWNQLHYPALRSIKLPEIKRYTLANGIRLFIVEDHRLPLVDGYALIRTGSRWEPAGETGLASITGSVMRSGGTATRTGDEIDRELEAIAASVESSIGESAGVASFSALKGDEDKVLDIFADMLMHPAFRQEKLELAKTFARTGISRRNDDAEDIAGREFRKLLYGANSPYARHAEYASIEAISRGDLVAFHQRYYHPNNVMIGISGDVDPEAVRAKIEKAFASWQPEADLRLPGVPEVREAAGPRLNLVRKEDVNQSSINIGQLGGELRDPDFFALAVMSQILCGGDFSSRITRKVRSEMGLAYSAAGDWRPGLDYRGVFSIYVGTKSQTTVKAIEAAMKEVRGIRESEVSEEELRIAKESLLNSFVFRFANPAQIMSRLITYIYYGYPEDFLERYRQNVEKVTRADVLRVARKYLDPDAMKILVVGNDKDFDAPLSRLAPDSEKVNTIDITIPEPAKEDSPGASAPPR
jgi:zinc protease